MSKYKMLTNILDSLRKEAPSKWKRYSISQTNEQHNNQARSLAYIHLFLKANFNLASFEQREKYVVDGPGDGGIDAYYIDSESKVIYFIQAKFRQNENNFEEKGISVDELSAMDIVRIQKGYSKSEDGEVYSGKIKKMQQQINNIEDIARYEFKVTILANIVNYKQRTIQSLIQLPYEIFDFERAYNKLVFPVLKGTCHTANDIYVKLNIGSKSEPSVKYKVEDEEFTTTVNIYFLPTIEIAKIINEYKNSILEYNPRSYLGISNNHVNPLIKESIVSKDNNLFSLFNNGITILSDKTSFSDTIGEEDMAQLILRNPQIINGGQTAHTLGILYDDSTINNNIFKGKEVLTKIITFGDSTDRENKLSLIEELSKATNQQSQVTEADRRANDKVQIALQNFLFEQFGYCYHRKTGEFHDGINQKYLAKDKVIDREVLLRIAHAINCKVAVARRNSERILFSSPNFEEMLNLQTNFNKLFFSYLAYKTLTMLETQSKKENDDYYLEQYGNALRYGKYAVVYVVSTLYSDNISNEEMEEEARSAVECVLNQWKEFEDSILEIDSNNRYFKRSVVDGVERLEYNYDGYYKGRTIDQDVSGFTECIEK
ncbi:AIPR family protein [Staphylococcus xylosus]